VIRASESEPSLPIVQQGIQRVYDEASTYYRNLRWDKNRLTRFERDLTRRTIEQEVGPEMVDSILEVGCGPGTWTALLAEKASHVTAVDLSPGMLEQARRAVPYARVEFVNADAATFEPDRRYDAAVSVRVLEYIPEWRAVINRLGRLVKPDGRVVVITKTPLSVWRGTGRERWFVAGPKRMVRRMRGETLPNDFWQKHISVRAMCQNLQQAGFVDIRVRPVIFGLPIFIRGTKQYPIVPKFAEPAFLNAAGMAWRWASARGETMRRASLVLSESYAVTARRGSD
jgi:ubiquinone/menaquinone biosynthesis C-methylase UbiE